MMKITLITTLILLMSCGAGEKEATNSDQKIGGVIPVQTNLVGDSYSVAKDLCFAFTKKRQAFNASNNLNHSFKIYESSCSENDYSFKVDVTAKVVRTALEEYRFDVLTGDSLIRQIETDKSGMLQRICADIDFNNSASDDQKKVVSVVVDEGFYRYFHSFQVNGSTYVMTRGRYVLEGDEYISEAIDTLKVNNINSNNAGIVSEREKVEVCSDDGFRKFKQVKQ